MSEDEAAERRGSSVRKRPNIEVARESRPPRVRVIGIRAPHRTLGFWLTAIYLTTSLVPWVAVSVFIVLPLTLLLGRALGSGNFGLMMVLAWIPAAPVGIQLMMGWHRIFACIADRIRKPQRPDRILRLQQLLDRPNAQARFPHRRLELELLTRRAWDRVNQKLLAAIPAGWVIVVNPPSSGAILPVCRRFQPFEPLDLERDPQALTYLWYENVGLDAEQLVALDQWFATERQRAPWYRQVWRFAWIPASLVGFVWIGLSTLRAILSGRSDTPLALFLLLAAFSLVILVKTLFFDRRCWLVPQGLIVVENWQWKSRRRITRARPETTPLVLDIDQRTSIGTAQFFVRSKRYTTQIFGTIIYGLAAGWLSTAAPPSHEQVRAFVNPD